MAKSLSINSDSESSGDYPASPPPALDENQASMKLVIVNVAAGCDVLKSILDIGRRGHTSLAVQSASGTIASVTLRHIPHSVPALRVYGPFNLLSLTGSYFYNNQHTLHPGATPPPSFSFGIHLSTSDGHVFGGNIDGPVIASKNVSLTIFTFKNPGIDKYVPEGEENDDQNDNNKNNKNCNNSRGDLSMLNSAS
ncbi:unnamed protein product [Sphenostylis stenocarpa]|uniref:PPC domain-containing protein n=1 Tax=Sphenostylis stenocarpa TaxID=92480 RepID=A0AA86SLX7_9FABA|nr:unnamed protein product [Sphenostylis stenocarpa]